MLEGTRNHHVENAIGLIEHKNLDLAAVKVGSLVHVLQQAPWRAHQDVHACVVKGAQQK
jgi:hypothetical protein